MQNSELGALTSRDIEPLFWTPERLGQVSAWWGHAPFAFWIIANSEPRSFVELGTHSGVSYAAFCEAVSRLRLTTRCYAVDTWVGDPQAGSYGEDVFSNLRDFHDQHYAAFSQLVRRTFDEANEDFADGTIDLLHIDGFHTYDAVRHDFETWRPKLSDRGIVLFHDSNERERGFGVWRLFEELKREAPSFEFLHGHGLGIVALGANAPAAIRQLCALTDRAHIGAVRERFSFLGSRWITTQEKLGLEAQARARELGLEAQARARELGLEAQARAREEVQARAREEVLAQTGLRTHQLELEIAQRDGRALALEDVLKIKESEIQLLGHELERSRQAYGALADASRRHHEDVSRELGSLIRNDLAEKLPPEFTGWRWMAPGRRKKLRRLITEYRLIAASPLFDSQWYLANNPDVAAKREDPALHYLLHGGFEGRAPGPRFDGDAYLSANPDVADSKLNPLLHYIRQGRLEGRQLLTRRDDDTPIVQQTPLRDPQRVSVGSLLRTHNAAWAPLPIFADHRSAPTLTVLTDSVDPDSLFGGVATAMVVGAFAARRLGGRLRLVTRNVPPDPSAVGNILRAHRVDWNGPTDFLHLPPGDQRPLSLGDKDVVLTTSWWTTRATLGSVNAARILYLLQEDERMFYPFGDERLRCMDTLSEPDLRILVNTQQLFDHLGDGPDPVPRLRERGCWFKPAFPSFQRPEDGQPKKKGKQDFFFYARPNHHRNLYWRGLEVINAAMREGVLAADQWNFHFVGREVPEMELPGGVRPTVWSRLPWSKYAELVSKMDLGLCLMDTPHPSYPPLDLAAAGAVVVTNTHGPKKSFDQWSRNIIAAPPGVSALTEALQDGVKLSRDSEQRFANCDSDHIPRDWEPQLDAVIERVLDGGASRACS